MRRMGGAAALGVVLALVPALVSAADPVHFQAQERALSPDADWAMVAVVTFIAVAALFLISGIGYLYRRERGLDWAFQLPDAPHDDHH